MITYSVYYPICVSHPGIEGCSIYSPVKYDELMAVCLMNTVYPYLYQHIGFGVRKCEVNRPPSSVEDVKLVLSVIVSWFLYYTLR